MHSLSIMNKLTAIVNLLFTCLCRLILTWKGGPYELNTKRAKNAAGREMFAEVL